MLYRLNYIWRLLATGFAFSIFGLGGFLVPLCAVPVLFLTSKDQQVRQRRARKLIHWVFNAFIKMARALGILTWDIEGLERLQKSGILILANHPTLLDVVFLVAFIPNADCIVKSGLLKNPAMRGFVNLAGYITNNSGEELIGLSAKSVINGSALIIFPEGTRTKDDHDLSFRRGAANIAVRGNIRPTPVVIKCNPATLSKQHKWYHIPARKFHLSIQVHSELNIDEYRKLNASLGARRLTRYMEDFFTKEVIANEHRLTRARA
jgi:1-acyl-sn-glycerol-3-phosphate acyltransferase